MTATFEVISRARGATTASHLSDDQIARLRAVLVAEREALTCQLDEHTRALVELGEDGTDRNGVERELVGLHAARTRDALEEIHGALGRLSEGSYGMCERCGRPIPFERLEVIPRARSCVACPPPGAFRR